MTEQEIFEEQPQTVETILDNKEGSSQDLESFAKEGEAERGVPVGKFKSVEDLQTAYNNLQSEFTRKCQKLAELEKDKMSKEPENDFEGDFKTFLLQNPEAYSFSDEIKQVAREDESLKNDKKAFEKVWANMIYQKLSAPNKANEPLVQNLVLNDENLKNLVIQNYLKQLQENKTPVVMSSGAGERVTKTATPKPDSFEQAKQVVLDLFS